MAEIVWIIEETGEKRFPYRLTIKKNDSILLRLRVQDRWPPEDGYVFCIREKEDKTYDHPLRELEREEVISFKKFGKKISIVLGRKKNRSCDFLFLKKPYKRKEGEYEQIFWTVGEPQRLHRPRVKVAKTFRRDLQILVSKDEKRPWKFNREIIREDVLPKDTYGLKKHMDIEAVVKRKSFKDMIDAIRDINRLHEELEGIKTYKYAALVIEAYY
ncbi:MAG: hypothetical protein D6828_03600, partial [Nitrospirae bacterium]